VKRFIQKLFAARRPVVSIADPSDLTAAIVALFRHHSIKTAEDAGAIDLPDHGCRVIPIVVSANIGQNACTCQLDVRFELSAGSVVVESFAEVGPMLPRLGWTRSRTSSEALSTCSCERFCCRRRTTRSMSKNG
jgi:hypothetical protein